MDGLLADRLDSRRKAFKKGVDSEDGRRKREDEAVSLRKAKREDMMKKKRQMTDPWNNAPDAENAPVNVQGQKELAKDTPMAAMAAKLAQPITPEERVALTTDIRKKLSKAHDPPTQEAVDAGLVKPMVDYIAQNEDTKLQFEALWVLTNIASGESQHTEAVIHGGAVPHLVQLLASPLMDTREQAIWALANIVGDSPRARDFVLQYNPVQAMLQLIVESEMQGRTGTLRNAVWALSNTCRGKPGPPLEAIAPALPYLARLIHHTDADVVGDTIWAFSYLSDGDSDRINYVLQTGCLPVIVAKLAEADERILQPAVRSAGNIAAGSDDQTQAVLESGLLPHMAALFQHRKRTVRKEALWTISNITAGTQTQIQQVIEGGLMQSCVEMASGADDWNVRKEALWCVANVFAGGNAQQLEFMAQIGAVQALCAALDQNNDHPTMVAVLDGLQKILQHGKNAEAAGQANPYPGLVEEADGLTKLEQLQEDENEAVYQRAVTMLETFFGAEDDEAENEGPSLVTGGFDFS